MHLPFAIRPSARAARDRSARFFARAFSVPALLLMLVPLFPSFAAAQTATMRTPIALIYVANTTSALESLRFHATSMDIIAPQTYETNSYGKLMGSPNPEILKRARDAGAQVMPLIVNQGFSQATMHTFLQNDAAQNMLIAALVNEAKENGYIGYQYDFEHMRADDRDRYTAFVEKSVPYFHGAGLQLSVALAPMHSDDPRDYGAGSWNNWTGAFDYRAIGQAADFVSVMAYDDSKSVGPAASLPWVKSVLEYALARIPSDKISLGVPFYTWVRRTKNNELAYIRAYGPVGNLLASGSYVKKGWSDELGVPFVTYYKGGSKYTAWYEDQRSFQEKVALVTDNKLLGFSAWALGQEDPKVWDVMLALRAPKSGVALNTLY